MQLKWPMLWDLFSLFPAHAGVIPLWRVNSWPFTTFPRTRGGDPDYGACLDKVTIFSPHTRG